jgi:UDP-2,3-diacylglucosamine hydrolase
LAERSKIYFASDFHLGLNAGYPAIEREKLVVKWLNEVAADAREIYLLGDIFDFWWEYKLVVPRGFTRFLGTISSITDSGIPVHFFTGNHDMWVGDYMSKECGMIVHTEPFSTEFDGRIFHLAHGEGLGTNDRMFRILLRIFHNKPLRALYSSLHPSIGVGFGLRWSLSSRLGKGITKEFLGEEKEDLIRYSKGIASNQKFDYFIYGHRHLAMRFPLKEGGEIIFLGDWIRHSSYACWNGSEIEYHTL